MHPSSGYGSPLIGVGLGKRSQSHRPPDGFGFRAGGLDLGIPSGLPNKRRARWSSERESPEPNTPGRARASSRSMVMASSMVASASSHRPRSASRVAEIHEPSGARANFCSLAGQLDEHGGCDWGEREGWVRSCGGDPLQGLRGDRSGVECFAEQLADC